MQDKLMISGGLFLPRALGRLPLFASGPWIWGSQDEGVKQKARRRRMAQGKEKTTEA
jgi:hypothetical protein